MKKIMHNRSGTMVIYCLALATVLLVIAYGFVRASRLDLTASDISTKTNLAQSAARMGQTHVMEQIAAEVANQTIDVATGDGTSLLTYGPPTHNPAPTFLDGPFRAPFIPLTSPNKLRGADLNRPSSATRASDADSVSDENPIVYPVLSSSNTGDSLYRWYQPLDGLSTCARSMSEGRGRYIEPDFHNMSRPDPRSADPILQSPSPTQTTRYTDRLPALPERHQGLYLDAQFRRISASSELNERLKARYRLRYSSTVEDLGGHLLSNAVGCHSPNDIVASNPDTHVWPQDAVWNSTANGVVAAWKNPNAPYRTPPSWMQGAQHAWYNIMRHMTSIRNQAEGSFLSPYTAEHVFLGRGISTNTDRNSINGYPTSFPMMLRTSAITSTGKFFWWGRWSSNGSLESSVPGDPTAENFSHPEATYSGTSKAGGEYLGYSNVASDADNQVNQEGQPLVVGGFGPQLSWFNTYASICGIPMTQHLKWASYAIPYDPSLESMFCFTPYGQRLVASSKPSAQRKWYEGEIDTPWFINILTAPPTTIDCMIKAYLPPKTAICYFTGEKYFQYTAGANNNPPTFTPVGSYSYSTRKASGFDHRDLFTDLSGPAFAYYAHPVTTGMSPVNRNLDPNFQIPNNNPSRYPGSVWWNSDDTLGARIDVSYSTSNGRSLLGICTKTGQSFYAFPVPTVKGTCRGGGYTSSPTPPSAFFTDGGTTNVYPDPAASGLGTWELTPESVPDTDYNGAGKFAALDTYYTDIICAFTQSIAIARAAWVQYPSVSFKSTPTTISPDLRNPAEFDTLKEIDRIFLRQLGENIEHPGNPAYGPEFAVLTGSSPTFLSNNTYKPAYNLRTMIQAWISGLGALTVGGSVKPAITLSEEDAFKRGEVMERVLNDWRMSFLGSSPQYSDTFRPLDFTGDGYAHCTAYDFNETSAPGMKYTPSTSEGTAWWKKADSDGVGPRPDHFFSLTGCFYIGKSHYFRVWTRGELFDNVTQKPINDATLESVVAADPEGTNPHDLRVLFQRWHFNRYTAQQPQQLE